jgi:hypothetical protein
VSGPAQRRDRRVAAKALAFAATVASAGSCVTTYEEAPPAAARSAPPAAVPVAIPFGNEGVNADQGLLFAFYGGVFERMQAAVADRDPAQLEALVGAYERPDLPDRLRDALAAYRAMALGLRFQQHAAATATMTLVPAAGGAPDVVPPIGTPLTFRLEVPPSGVPVRLGGRGDDEPTCFAVAVTIDDTFVDGSTRSSHTQDFVWLPEAVLLDGGAGLQIPVEVDVTAGEAVQRVVHVRADLMPGYVSVGGKRAPVHRAVIGACTVTQWPAGHEVVAKNALAALRAAVRSGDSRLSAQVYLGAAFVRGEERDEAMRLLIEQVRFGRPDQALVAMSALRALTGDNLPLGDRQAWLAWWQARR